MNAEAAQDGRRPIVSAWTLRVVVLAALAATLWFAGPRAYRVLAVSTSRAAESGETVRLDRAGVIDAPAWLRGAVLRAVLADLEPQLRGSVPIMDDRAARELQAQLQLSSWVRAARVERRFPDRFRVAIDVRRPVLELRIEGRPVASIAADGVALPRVRGDHGLPQFDVRHGVRPLEGRTYRHGRPFPDARVVAAAAVAFEWQQLVAPRCAAGPDLVAVDAHNVGYRFVADPTYSQVVVGLRRDDEGVAWFHYGRAHAEGGPIAPELRAAIVEALVAEYPGLAGIVGGDLRLRNRWRSALRLSEPARVARAR